MAPVSVRPSPASPSSRKLALSSSTEPAVALVGRVCSSGRARSSCVEFCATGRVGATYDVRSDLAAEDGVHSNHDGGFGWVFGRRGADEGSMEGRRAAFGRLARGSFSGERAR
jgi:hypothetical protein